MSFNKKYFNIANLLILYRNGGIESIKNVLEKTDAIICNDKHADTVIQFISDGKYTEAVDLLENKLNVL